MTRSGTNQARGDAFYFNRNKALTSPDAFGQSLDTRQNQFGGSLGGAMIQNRMFAFGAAEHNILSVPFVVPFQPQAGSLDVPADLRALEGEQYGTNNPTALFARLDAVLTPGHTLNVQPMYTRATAENFNFDSRARRRPRRRTIRGARRAPLSRPR